MLSGHGLWTPGLCSAQVPPESQMLRVSKEIVFFRKETFCVVVWLDAEALIWRTGQVGSGEDSRESRFPGSLAFSRIF